MVIGLVCFRFTDTFNIKSIILSLTFNQKIEIDFKKFEIII